jgi:hypothetical protein
MSLILSGTDGLSDVDGTAATPAIRGTDANTGIFFPAADTIGFAEGGAEVMRIDSSGNVGIGVTPSAWGSAYKPLQINAQSALWGTTDSTFLSTNEYVDSAGQPRYIQTGTAMRYRQDGGTHIWSYAASGTAGNALTYTQAMTLNNVGGLKTLNTVGVGNATPSTSGAGITFPATQSASSDANTLDDYEEGSWTPTLGGNTTYTVQEGQYIKIGQLVFIFFDIGISTIGTGSTNTISGVPFTAANVPNVATAYTLSFSYFANIATSITWLSGYVPENATTISCSGNQTSATSIQSNGFAVFANGARISGSGTYRASA